MNFDYIIFSILLIVVLFLTILGIYCWKKEKIVVLGRKKDISEHDVKEYTRYLGMAYIIMGISLLPLIIMGLIGKHEMKYAGTLIWFIGFIIGQIINKKVKKKFQCGLF